MDCFAVDFLLVTCYSVSVPPVLLLRVSFWLLSLYPLSLEPSLPPFENPILQFGKGLGGFRLTFTHSPPEPRKSLASCPMIPALQIALSLFLPLFFPLLLPLYLYMLPGECVE